MADPVTLGAIGIGSAVAGAGTGAIGSLLSGGATAASYSYQAGVAKINQQIQKQNADYSRSVGEVEAQESGMKSRAQAGEIVAAQGANGLDVNRGSNAAVQSSQQEIGQFDQAVIRSNAAKRAYGYEVEASQQEAQANLYSMAASKSKTAGVLGAFSSILGGASSVATKWLDASRVGIGTNPTNVGSATSFVT